jgi:hypothetical protein
MGDPAPLEPPRAAASAEVRGDAAPRVTGLECPGCGGALEARAGERVVRCRFCGESLLVWGRQRSLRYGVEPKLDGKAAAAAARGWLASGLDKHRGLRAAAVIVEARLAFLPFFRSEADVVGLVLGTVERTRQVGSGSNARTEQYEVEVELPVEVPCDRTDPGVDVAEWGLERVDLRGDPLVPWNEERFAAMGLVFPPTVAEETARLAAHRDFLLAADPTPTLKRHLFRWLATTRARSTVVHYPLWLLRYEFAGRAYPVVVDAEDGTIAYGKAPGNDAYRAAMLVLTQAAGAFLATTAARYSFAQGELTWLALGVGAAWVMLRWGWKRFRYGGEVIEGTGLPAVAPANGVVQWVQWVQWGQWAQWLRRLRR